MWFTNLLTSGGVGTTVLMLSVAIFAGLLLGRIKVKGISLGITWVLFVGIALGAAGVTLQSDMLHVVRELGLIFFVTAVGLQVGPGFFRSFRQGGLSLNLVALVNVLLGVAVTYVIAKLAHQDMRDMAGVYTGAVTNTPGLMAAQEAAGTGGDAMANGYAVTYPLAVVGMIVSCLLLRLVGRSSDSNAPAETSEFKPDKSATPVSQRHKVNLIPLFIIIAIGIVLGSVPVPVGLSAPVKLGLAGGPLVVALIGSWLGVKKGWFTTDFTDSHGVWMLREVGIALFLAGVGLGAGGKFVDTVQEHYMWVFYGIIITMLPPLVTGLYCRLVMKVNIHTLMGVIGGMHTDPPTLAFANTVAPEGCKLPNIGYATVYPLTMFLRILTAQLLVLMA
ncbi:MAG: hypothetical protein IJT39_01155 [Bacteroidales bacterium]|nr:hypothetical protein [Bacteroidales bacterium]